MDYLARLIVALLLLSSSPAFCALVIEHNTWDGAMRWRDVGDASIQGIRFPPNPSFAAGTGTDVVVSRGVTFDLAGAAEAAVTEAGTITALDVAKGAISLMRGGLAGAAISIAIPVVMEAAKLAWNGSNFTEPGDTTVADPANGYFPIVGQGTAGVGQPYDICKSDQPDVVVWQTSASSFEVKEIGSVSPFSGSQFFNCPSGTGWKSGARAWFKSLSNSTECSVGVWDNNTMSCSVAPPVVVDDDKAANDMANNMGTSGPDIAGGVYDNGGTMQSSDPTASGPSVVSGPTTTSTSTSDAGTTTTTTHTDYGMGYQGDTVTVTPTTTTTTTTPDGKQTTTTQTAQPGDSGGDAPPADSQQQKVMCDKYPNASGCDELGTPTDVDMPTQTVNVALSPTLSAAGSCPAPISIPVLGKTYSLSWQPVCDFATGVRPIVLALSWLGAGLFIFMVARG